MVVGGATFTNVSGTIAGVDQLRATTGIGTNAAGYINFNGRTMFRSPVDGKLKITNDAETVGGYIDLTTANTFKFFAVDGTSAADLWVSGTLVPSVSAGSNIGSVGTIWANVYSQSFRAATNTNPFYALGASSDVLVGRQAAGVLIFGSTLSNGVTANVATNSTIKFFAMDGTSAATVQSASYKMTTATAFAAGDKYVVIDASGNLHVSALGPVS